MGVSAKEELLNGKTAYIDVQVVAKPELEAKRRWESALER